jgi:hypothetical protein
MDRADLLERVFEAFRASGTEEKVGKIKIARVYGFPNDCIGLEINPADNVAKLFVWPSFDQVRSEGTTVEQGLMLTHSIHMRNPNWYSEETEIHDNFQSCTQRNRFSDDHRELCMRVMSYTDELQARNRLSRPE